MYVFICSKTDRLCNTIRQELVSFGRLSTKKANNCYMYLIKQTHVGTVIVM